jgi:hypothetical protein
MLAVARPALFTPQARFMSDHHDEAPKYVLNKDGVVIPELVESLEWLLDSPPNVHQFEEPPVIIVYKSMSCSSYLCLIYIYLFSDCCRD